MFKMNAFEDPNTFSGGVWMSIGLVLCEPY